LGFEVLKPIHFMPVNYVTSKASLAKMGLSTIYDFQEHHVTELLTTKYDAWSYEQEERCFCELQTKDPISGLYFQNFAPALSLQKVIVGARSDVTRSSLKEILGNRSSSVETFKVRAAHQTFEMVENQLQSAWKA
jgi:hypothetical protein